MINKVIFPGTFDPMTLGHENVIQRAAQLFPEVLVAVAESPGKAPLLSLDQRLTLTKDLLAPLKNVMVQPFNGLLVQFAKAQNASAILRSLRTSHDFEYENQLTMMNQRMAPELETLYLTPAPDYSAISSSLVREIFRLGGDISPFVSPQVIAALGN